MVSRLQLTSASTCAPERGCLSGVRGFAGTKYARSLKSPKGRIGDQDEDGVDAEVLFPTPRLFEAMVTAKGEELHLALIRAYNDWLSEFCSAYPDRLLGLAALPNCGVDAALEELTRVMPRREIRGFVMGQYPAGGLDLSVDNDPVWEALAEASKPLHIHVKLTNRPPGGHPGPLGRASKLNADPRFFDVPERILQFIGAEVFDRFPGLNLTFVEADCGWVPYFKEQLSDRQSRHAFGAYAPPRPVLDYFRHFFFTFITDHVAIHERHTIGIDQMLWSTDYPHTASDWPFSARSIASDFTGIPQDERDRICAGNAVRLYGLT